MGSDQGTETDGETDVDTDGGDRTSDGESYSTTDRDNDTGNVSSTLTVTGTQTLTQRHHLQRQRHVRLDAEPHRQPTRPSETDTDSDSDSDSGTEIDLRRHDSYSDGARQATTDETIGDDDYRLAGNEIDAGSESIGLVRPGRRRHRDGGQLDVYDDYHDDAGRPAATRSPRSRPRPTTWTAARRPTSPATSRPTRTRSEHSTTDAGVGRRAGEHA